jgi:LAO/AO transport system kinase
MTASDRVARVRAGDRRALAALMRDLDDDVPGAREEVALLRATGGATSFVVGVTGAPGAGKSTLLDALVAGWRARGERVGVVTIDPTSPVGGGAVLGDRVRMQRHAGDEGVFIRSLATRGVVGGLSRSAIDTATVLAAGGFPSVLIETVGVGQADVEIAYAADVTVLVTAPGLGDDVQTLKAGILEMADVLVVNKSDRAGADQVVQELQAMLELRHTSGTRGPWDTLPAPGDVVVVQTVAPSAQGIPALVAAIDAARARGRAGGTATESPHQKRRAEARIRGIVIARTAAALGEALGPGGASAALVDDVAALRMDPHAAADVLMARLRGGY